MPSTDTAFSRTEPMSGVKGKGVLVTGGTSGIGQTIAVRFAEHSAHVAINYRREPDEATDTEQRVQACVAKVRRLPVRRAGARLRARAVACRPRAGAWSERRAWSHCQRSGSQSEAAEDCWSSSSCAGANP